MLLKSPVMTDPLEKQFQRFLEDKGIEFTRPERDPLDPTNLDFYIPKLDLYVEIKRFHTERLIKQVAAVPHEANTMILVGNNAIWAFLQLMT